MLPYVNIFSDDWQEIDAEEADATLERPSGFFADVCCIILNHDPEGGAATPPKAVTPKGSSEKVIGTNLRKQPTYVQIAS